MLSALAMSVVTVWQQASPLVVIGYSLSSALFVLGLIIAWQTHQHNKFVESLCDGSASIIPKQSLSAVRSRSLLSTFLFGSGLTFKAFQSNGALVFHITNTGNKDPLRECRICITEFRLWSLGQKTFVLIEEFDQQRVSLPILIYGPNDLYVDQPMVCHFIETTNNKDLAIRSVEARAAGPWIQLPKKTGIWCAYLRLQVSQREYMHRICFEWFPGQRLKFIQCPDYSLADL